MNNKKYSKSKSKSRWQQKKEKHEQKYSQFDPKIHQLGREGYGFQMKKDIEATQDELSGKNLPFKTEKK